MEFYKIKDDKITLSNKLTHNDVVFVLNGTMGYVWKGDNARDLDESRALKIEQLLNEKFTSVNYDLIPRLEILEKDNLKLKQIKSEISKRIHSSIKLKFKKNQKVFFNKLKHFYCKLLNYDNSTKWRKKLSNLTNIWKLSIFNVIILVLALFIISNQSIINLYNGDILLLLCFVCLFIALIANLMFIIFPLRFPIKFLTLEDSKDKAQLKKEIKPKGRLTGESIKKEDSMEDLKTYLSKEDLDLNIPVIPEKPKTKKITSSDLLDVQEDTFKKISEYQAQNKRVILVNCGRCKKVIPVPIPKNLVFKSDLPVVPISYVHRNMQDKDQHCITIYIDHDFDIRRQRISDVILS